MDGKEEKGKRQNLAGQRVNQRSRNGKVEGGVKSAFTQRACLIEEEEHTYSLGPRMRVKKEY